MNIKEKDFFHQATIRICGCLEIDKALMDCFNYLKNYIPLDEMRLDLLDDSIGAFRCIAVANSSGKKKRYSTIPLPHSLRNEIEKRGLPMKAAIFNRLELDPVVQKIVNMLGPANSSLIALPLLSNGVWLGGLFLHALGKDRYTDEHARLLAMLHDPFAVAMSNALRYEEVLKLKNMLADDNQYLSREIRNMTGDEIIGGDLGLSNVMELVKQVAPRDNLVLLLGETGVGKEVIANAIHSFSSRRDKPFIKINCGAIPENLIDSELFGHEKGAFTGAIAQKRGRFERADGGTIFLDEIGDLPMQAQIRLLRVIQEKEIDRVGGTKTISVDVRIIAATHRNLEQMVEKNIFREDLWYRLNVFPVIIPPLRHRKMDIPALVEFFLKRKSKELNLPDVPSLAKGAVDRLMDYHWKGNVRELENLVERELIQYTGGLLNFDSLVFSNIDDMSENQGKNDRILKLSEVDARHITSVLKKTNGKISGPGGAAELLGLHPNTLGHRMDKLGIPFGRKKQNRPIQ